MKDNITKLVLFIFLVLGCFHISGQENHEVYIKFKVGKSTLNETLGNNADRLSELITFLEKAKSDSVLQFVEISFCGSASPEGPLALNCRLSANRRKALENYIRSKISFPFGDSIVTRCDDAVTDWELLARLVEDSDMPHKDEAIDVIRLVPEFTYDHKGVPVESRKRQLMKLQYGRTWKYMLRHFYPQLRYARLEFETVLPEIPFIGPESSETALLDNTLIVLPPPAYPEPIAAIALPTPRIMQRHGVIWALKTNLLYDALTLPNLGAELRIADRWSVSGNWMYGWWKNNYSRHYFLRAYGGELSIRRYFGSQAAKKIFSGHHAGVYGQLFTYDFRKGSHGYMGGKPGGTLWDKISYAAGVEYGYSLPLHSRIHLDMSVGVGYMSGIIHDYTPMDGCKVWQRTRTKSWFGPTKAEVSLVWLIGKGGGL